MYPSLLVSAEERERRAKGREELRYKGLKGLSTVLHVCSHKLQCKSSYIDHIPCEPFQLFNHYIKPSGLWESGLHALKVAHYVDEALTKRFWKSIINEGTCSVSTARCDIHFHSGPLHPELHKLQTTGFNLDSLRGKIVSLGQSLERDENVFPAGTITQTCCRGRKWGTFISLLLLRIRVVMRLPGVFDG